MVGGTLVMWAAYLDPYASIHPNTTSAFTALVLQIPGYQVSIHVALYLPTAGRDQDFVSELSSLRNCLEELAELYPRSILFIRGDSNVNKNNKNRVLLLSQLLENFSLKRVKLEHDTYHHFVGQGLYDSDIDVLIHSDKPSVSEQVVTILCKFEHPSLMSHHDIILSQCSVPASPTTSTKQDHLVTAPRVSNDREKIIWSTEGAANYEELVSPLLRSLRDTWLDPSSTASMSVLLQMTNKVLSCAASSTNKTVNLSARPAKKPTRTPKQVRMAEQKLRREHKKWKRSQNSDLNKSKYKAALKSYKTSVRRARLEGEVDRDSRLLTILSENSSSLYSFLKTSKNTSISRIEKLIVQDKTYLGHSALSVCVQEACIPSGSRRPVSLRPLFETNLSM